MTPVVTMVLPWPDPGAATRTRGSLTTDPLAAAARSIRASSLRSWDAHSRSPLDSPLALLPGVHRVLDLGHLGDEVGRLDQSGSGIASCNDDVLVTGAVAQGRYDLVDVDPAPLHRVGELVQHV